MNLLHRLSGRPLPACVVLAIASLGPPVLAQNPAQDDLVEDEAVVVPMPLNNNTPNGDMFDQWVFNRLGGSAATRGRLDTVLALHVDELNRSCGLSPAQVKKLQLAGHGDIKRFFDRVGEAKRKFLESKNNPPNNNLWIAINPLQTALNVGLFGDDSIFAKTIKTTLNTDQAARYAEIQHQRNLERYRITVDWWVVQVDKALGLSDDQRRELADLLVKEGRPPRRFGRGDYWYVMLQAARLPQGKLKSILDDVQWRLISNQVNQARGMEAWLKQNGTIPDQSPAAATERAAPALMPAAVLVPAVPALRRARAKTEDPPAQPRPKLQEKTGAKS
jgi:hypothetical protein